MNKFISLLKASTKGELNIFKIKSAGKLKYLLIGFLIISILFTSYTYAEVLAEPLYEVGLTHIVISLFSFAIVILTIIEGIYKSQGIIFDAKDNNMLFSMPINKSYILITRFLKILIFDYMFEFLFLIPCFAKYALLENPAGSFYILSIIFLILLPLLPLVISCIVGYLIKTISVRFKNKKLVQTIITIIFFLTILFISLSMEGIVTNLIEKATSINDLISKIYLPIGLFIDIILDFKIINLIQLIFISVLPFSLFIILFSKKYDEIINYGKENSSKRKNKDIIKKTSILKSLVKKELKSYFGIPIYIINTIISPLMVLLLSGAILIKNESVIEIILEMVPSLSITKIYQLIPYLFIAILLVVLALASITACSISLEGKKYSLLKSLPINENKIFLAKILLNDIILIPPFLVGAIVFIIKFEIYNLNILFMILATLLLPHINGQIGLLINLMFPKLNYNSEVEVVKQSLAVFISMFINLLFAILILFTFYKLIKVINPIFLAFTYTLIFINIALVLNEILKNYGIKRFREIN